MSALRPAAGMRTTGLVPLWLAAFAFAALGASPASAQYYGAIGYSPTTGAMGWGIDYPTSDGAARTALSRCADHAADCRVAVLFKDGCGLVAAGEDGYAAAASPSRSDAERIAMRRCRLRTDGCTVQRWVCTTGAMY